MMTVKFFSSACPVMKFSTMSKQKNEVKIRSRICTPKANQTSKYEQPAQIWPQNPELCTNHRQILDQSNCPLVCCQPRRDTNSPALQIPKIDCPGVKPQKYKDQSPQIPTSFQPPPSADSASKAMVSGSETSAKTVRININPSHSMRT